MKQMISIAAWIVIALFVAMALIALDLFLQRNKWE
jgi:hypothetical protein